LMQHPMRDFGTHDRQLKDLMRVVRHQVGKASWPTGTRVWEKSDGRRGLQEHLLMAWMPRFRASLAPLGRFRPSLTFG
jgi:hypothetical protein